jgi:hypothetical protein
MTSPLGDAAIEAAVKQLFGAVKRHPDEGKIVHTPQGYEFHLRYDEAAIARVAIKHPWLLPELLAELERNRL